MNSQQVKFLTRDTILTIFQKSNNIFEAIDEIKNTISYEAGYLDYKSLYFDNEIKSYFLKSLDRNFRCKYELELENKKYIKLLDNKKRLEYEIESYLIGKKRRKQIDSVLKSEKLISKFKDSIIVDRISLYKSERNCKGAIPNLDLLTKLKYPEVYDSIKKWSRELPERNFTEELLAFNDPDTQKQYDLKVKQYVQTNGKYESFRYYENKIKEVNTAFVFSKINNLLSINNPEVVMYEHVIKTDGTSYSIGIETSPNFDFTEKVFVLANRYEIPCVLIKEEFNKVRKSNDTKAKDKFVKTNIESIKNIVKECCIKMNKDEEYWMVNMPFYKKN
ncbi:hypothetical protein BWK62_15050 [Flavobacterium oreochromis]|nr:hypothetical protein BWK62_15050 [Flavobacterium oreochromis]OWP74277.1 hypothetical protein BWG23_14380 [Flavobacterium oreochromis]POR19411.1 hypothetical protein BWK58_14385 [Flavobacterium columnare]